MAVSRVTNLYPVPAPGVTDVRETISTTVKQFSSNMTGNGTDGAWAHPVKYVVFDIQGANVMVTFDGSDPSSSNGHKLYDGQSYTWDAVTTNKARFIRAASTDATIHFSAFTD